MESYAAPVQVCRALHTDGFYPLPPKNWETLYPENMPVFYNFGIFTATATNSLALFMNVIEFIGDCGGTLVKVLCYKSEGHWFDPRWCHRNFSLTKSIRSHYGPGVDTASNRNEYQEHFLGVKVPGA